MGAEDFYTFAKGKDAHEAFTRAVKQARHDHGHSGYTGTIAEKHSFTKIDTGLKTEAGDGIGRKVAIEKAQSLVEEDDERVRDKWGPAGCIELGGGMFLFFGLASS